MDVNNSRIKGLIEGKKQFEVPIWQRQYTWTEEQHQQLWEDLLEQYEILSQGPISSGSGHFFGSVVLSPQNPMATGVTRYQVIDGQQRLTTVMLLLCAIRDLAGRQDQQQIEIFNNDYLLNQYQEGSDRYRLLPTEEDRQSFLQWIKGSSTSTADASGPSAASADSISKAYNFYYKKLQQSLEQDQPIDLQLLASAVLERLEIVEITTQEGDSAHRIFQSLNGTGVRLNQADLLRNHIFMLLPTQAERVYEDFWRPMERLLGPENLAALARLDLLRRGQEVKEGDVYEQQQKLLAPIAADEQQVEQRVADLNYRAKLYALLIKPEQESYGPAREILQRLKKWNTGTSHPVLIKALDLRERNIITDQQLSEALHLVESFYIRRHLARIPTNHLNKAFIRMAPLLPEDAEFVQCLHSELSRDILSWPSDSQIQEAVRRVEFFRAGSGWQRKLVLEMLERSFEHREVIDFQAVELQVEHVMPQTLNSEWRSSLEKLGQDPDEVHDSLLHTLGNLTLTAFNGELSNHPIERKKQIYQDSNLLLNRELAETKNWGRDEILARAGRLAQQICTIWAAPLPGVTSQSASFDWSIIEAAVEAIPAGRWTSYGDLAELGGTAPLPVGQHVAKMRESSRAYRVLAADGDVSKHFTWDDPSDQRDVRQVLAEEGIKFIDNQADEKQKLSAEDLMQLLDDEQLSE